MPDFGPVQNNISFNDSAGTTRGIHAEPWDKFISVGVRAHLRRVGRPALRPDIRDRVHRRARSVACGVRAARSRQWISDARAEHGLHLPRQRPLLAGRRLPVGESRLTRHWPSSGRFRWSKPNFPRRTALSWAWPTVTPIPPRKTLVLGAGGQLGRALREAYDKAPHVEFADRADLDLTSGDLDSARRWQDYDTIINAAAYTAVDAAETAEGRVAAWAANVTGVAALARVAAAHRITLVHVSSDYVFDGTATRPYREDDPVAPLGVYGQTKAAGDQIVSTVPRHYILRTSWVIGDGRNFVRTMLSLAAKGVDPSVVNDQFGRLTFTSELARAIQHLVETGAPYGTYNVSWVRRGQFVGGCGASGRSRLAGHDPNRVSGVSTAEYFSDATTPVAPRPAYSVLDLTKIESTGFTPADADEMLDGLRSAGNRQLDSRFRNFGGDRRLPRGGYRLPARPAPPGEVRTGAA